MDVGSQVIVGEYNNRFNGQKGTVINIGRDDKNRKVYFVELEGGAERPFF